MALINLDNKNQVIILVVAIAIGIVAAVMVGQLVSQQVKDERAKFEYDYKQDQKSREEQFAQQLTSLKQDMDQKVAQASKEASEATRAALAAANAKPVAVTPPKKVFPSLARKTPSGKRAITVKIDSLGAVGGLISPDDFVDVIAHLDVPSSRRTKDKEQVKESVTAMVFQNLQVLAVNTNLNEPAAYDDQQKVEELKVTFAVDPQEAGLLAFADKNGKIELALRSPNEKGRKMLSAATWATLAEYVLENNGAEIEVPDQKTTEVNIDKGNERPIIQIYRGGREL